LQEPPKAAARVDDFRLEVVRDEHAIGEPNELVFRNERAQSWRYPSTYQHRQHSSDAVVADGRILSVTVAVVAVRHAADSTLATGIGA
jgi:hypothetical protein